MKSLYEQSDSLTSPFEAFICKSDSDTFYVKPHWHYFVEILYILEGQVEATSNDQVYLLNPGDVIIFHPHILHSIDAISEGTVSYIVLKFDINSIRVNSSYTPKFSQVLRSSLHDENAPIFFPNGSFEYYPIKEQLMFCVYELKHKDYGYDVKVHGILSTLLIEFIRIWRQYGFNADLATLAIDSNYTMSTILEYIDEHSNDVLKIEDLALMCNMSYSYFAKSFQKLYGMSCKQYIDFIKISKIKDMLLFTNYDLTYISQETGFSDCSHLIRTFKKCEGITPKQFRVKNTKRS